MNPLHPSCSNAEQATAAWGEIIGFLTGRHADVRKVSDAVQALQKTRPDMLLRLRNAVQDTEESRAVRECRDVLERLEDYLGREPRPEDSMATVSRHLAVCPACARQLAALQELMPSRMPEKAVAPAVLKLVAREWRLAQGDAEHLLRDARDAVAFRRPVGRLRLRDFRREEQEWAIAAPDTLPRLPLSVLVGEGAAEVDLLVVPEHREAGNVWILRFTLVPTSRVLRLEVGVGRTEGQTTGMRTLAGNRKAEFELEPPGAHSYWAYFEWLSAENDLKTDKVELPLWSEGEARSGK